MVGRQVIETRRAFTLEELEQFMRQHWDVEQYNDFMIGKPTPASVEDFILLPATPRFMVIVYARKAGGFFNKKNKVILSVCDSLEGITQRLATTYRKIDNKANIIAGIASIAADISIENERKGPAEDILQKYAAYLRGLLAANGHTA